MLACFAVALYALVRGITARMPWESAWLALTGQCCGLLIGSKAAMKESPNIYRLIDLADPFSAQAADLLVNTYGWRVVASEPSEIADLRQPLLQLFHARLSLRGPAAYARNRSP